MIDPFQRMAQKAVPQRQFINQLIRSFDHQVSGFGQTGKPLRHSGY
jgi:hypothetical protein